MSNAIDSKTKRDKLTPRREPYWSPLQKGAAVGFRKLETGDGTWIARWRDDEGKQKYRALGNLEKFDDAAKAARAWVDSCEQGAKTGVTTVKEVCEDYIKALKAEGRHDTAKDAEGRFTRLVYDEPIAKLPIDKLRATNVSKWLNDQIEDDEDADEEDVRRSKDSANRNLATLKAALNLGLQHRLVATDSGWATVQKFPKVGARRPDAFLGMEQRKALLAACPDDLALFVKAALLTGARPGELATLNAGDFDKQLGALTLTGKTGTRTVTLSTAATAFFKEQAKSKLPTAPLLADAYGNRWNKDSWKKRFRAAVKAAGLPDSVVMYTLRHVGISELIAGGVDVFLEIGRAHV